MNPIMIKTVGIAMFIIALILGVVALAFPRNWIKGVLWSAPFFFVAGLLFVKAILH